MGRGSGGRKEGRKETVKGTLDAMEGFVEK